MGQGYILAPIFIPQDPKTGRITEKHHWFLSPISQVFPMSLDKEVQTICPLKTSFDREATVNVVHSC